MDTRSLAAADQRADNVHEIQLQRKNKSVTLELVNISSLWWTSKHAVDGTARWQKTQQCNISDVYNVIWQQVL